MSLDVFMEMTGALWTAEKYQIIQEEVKAVMPPAARHLERELKAAAPVASGQLQDSIRIEHWRNGMGAAVVSDKWQAIPIDSGSEAAFAPIEPVRQWVEVKLGITGDEANRVAHAIVYDHSQLGQEPAKFWWATWDRLVPTLNSRYLDGVGASIVNKTRKGRKTTKKVTA